MPVYQLQIANVKWNGEISNSFKIGNGVKLGAVSSSIHHCVYMNDLFILVKKKKLDKRRIPGNYWICRWFIPVVT